MGENIVSKKLTELNYYNIHSMTTNNKYFIRKFYKNIIDSLYLIRTFGCSDFLNYLHSHPMEEKQDNFECEIESIYNALEQGKIKIVVYTAIFGDVDSLIEPIFVNENIDYVAITDQQISDNSVWKKYMNEKTVSLTDEFPTNLKNRFCKLFPNLFFPEYDYSIYVDGNIRIISDLCPFVGMLKEKYIGLFNHPFRDDIYMEAMAVVKLHNANTEEVMEQMRAYRTEGFPEGYGLFENSIIVRRHNSKECICIMEKWWEQLSKYTKRDQLSLMYVLWKNQLSKDDIRMLGTSIVMCPRVQRIDHLTSRQIGERE